MSHAVAMEQRVLAVLRAQDGVIGRFQLIEMGAQRHDLERLLRRRDLVRVHPGVYVNHTGRPSPRQVEAAAVLRYWPAALASFSAVGLESWRRPPHVIVDFRRTVVGTSGIVVSRCHRFAEVVRTRPFPPRQRIEEAALDAAAGLANTAEVFTFLADVVQTRRTTARRLRETLDGRRRIGNRAVMQGVLADLDAGVGSVLEREWAAVERRHGLPTARRQERFRIDARNGMRDVVYQGFGVVVELDGRGFHDTAAARDADAARDLRAAAAQDLLTVRLTYGQVFREPCVTAARVAQLLQRRGWTGNCGRCCRC